MSRNNQLREILLGLARTDRRGRKAVMPADVVKAASAKDHPLHSRFEWDDSKAAHKWRIEQAREMIASVMVDYEDRSGETIRVQAFHHVRSEGTGYYPTETIIQHETLRQSLVREMTEDSRAMAKRLRTFERDDKILRLVRNGVALTLRGLRKARSG